MHQCIAVKHADLIDDDAPLAAPFSDALQISGPGTAVSAIIDGNPSGTVEYYSPYMDPRSASGGYDDKFVSSIQTCEPRGDSDGLDQLTFPSAGLPNTPINS